MQWISYTVQSYLMIINDHHFRIGRLVSRTIESKEFQSKYSFGSLVFNHVKRYQSSIISFNWYKLSKISNISFHQFDGCNHHTQNSVRIRLIRFRTMRWNEVIIEFVLYCLCEQSQQLFHWFVINLRLKLLIVFITIEACDFITNALIIKFKKNSTFV